MAKQRKNKTKSKIVKAAWTLFRQQGYEDTTVDEIIAASGTSKGSFYHYFESKDALLSSLSYLFDDTYEELAPQLDNYPSATEKLLFLNHQLFLMIDESVDVNLLSRLYSSQLITKAEQHLLDENRFYFQLILSIIKEGYERDEFRKDRTVDELVQLYVMYERALIYDWCLNKGSYSLSGYSDKLISDFLWLLSNPALKRNVL